MPSVFSHLRPFIKVCPPLAVPPCQSALSSPTRLSISFSLSVPPSAAWQGYAWFFYAYEATIHALAPGKTKADLSYTQASSHQRGPCGLLSSSVLSILGDYTLAP